MTEKLKRKSNLLEKQEDYRKEIESYGLIFKEERVFTTNDILSLECCNGHTINTSLFNLRKRKGCVECKRLSKFYEAISILEKEGYKVTYKEDDYINTRTKISYICNKGHEWSTSVTKIKAGKRCKHCKDINLRIDRRRSIEDVYKMFTNEDYEVLGLLDEYKNEDTRLMVKCDNNHIYETTIGNFSIGYRCKKCWFKNNRGENSCNWQGGITELNNYLRTCVNGWKRDSLIKSNYRCFISGEKGELEVHHHINFSDIVKETLIELNLDIKDKVKDYTLDEVDIISKVFVDKHYKYGLGVIMLKEIHKLFHSVYGIKNNTMEQVLEFKQDYLNGKFDDVLSA